MHKNDSGLVLKSLREASNLSQRDLANLAGVSRTKIFDIEQGKSSAVALADKINTIIAERLDLAYVAGLFDRKSSITTLKNKPDYVKRGPGRVDNPSPHYVVRVEFLSRHKLLIDIIHKVFKCGSITTIKQDGQVRYWKFMAWSKNAERVLEELYPYLRLKRQQAELLLQLRFLQNSNHCKTTPENLKGVYLKKADLLDSNHRLTAAALSKMEDIHQTVHALNRRLS